MKKLLGLFAIIAIQGCQVKSIVNLSSYTILRENYFDTSSFDLPVRDTNKFNPVVLEKVLQTAQIDDSASLLLMETVFDVPLIEYKLFDYKTSNVYILSTQDKEFTFKKVRDTSSISQISFLWDKIDLLQQKATLQPRRLSHGPHYIVNFIEVRNPIIVIKSIHLLDL